MDPEKFKFALEQNLQKGSLDVNENDYKEFDKQIVMLERLSEVQNSSVIVFDFHKLDYIFRRTTFSEELGHDSSKADELGFAYFVSLVHPDDFPVLLDTYMKAFSFIDQLPIEEKKDYKLINTFRTKASDGTYHTMIDQVIVLELDKQGNIWLILGISDLLPSKHTIDKANRQFVNIKTKMLYLFNENKHFEGKSILSAREIEVLGLVSKGFASKEIAERLYISVNTVNNHRQKILEKMNASNTAEAVAYAGNLGFI
jgi:DNA-binding CsgD family transcriptional regulator